MTQDHIEKKRAACVEQLQKARAEVEGWARRVYQLEGAIASLNDLLADVEKAAKEPTK